MKTKDDRTKTKPAEPDVDMEALIKEARERPNILPKLGFGPDKLTEGYNLVVIREAAFRRFAYTSPLSGEQEKALAIAADLIDTDFPGNTLGQVEIILPLQSSEEKNMHGLTAGVLREYDACGKNLSGVTLRIETRNYTHKKLKTETRGYTVTRVKTPDQAPTGL